MSNYNEYVTERVDFFKRHGECRVHDHGMNGGDRYAKTYAFEDGAIWCEVSGPVFEDVQVEVKGVKTTATVKLFRTEYWSSEAGSKFMYDRY